MSDQTTHPNDEPQPVGQGAPRSRRTLLAAGLGGLGALVAQALGRSQPVSAASYVQLGTGNIEATATIVKSTSSIVNASALLGQITASSPGTSSSGVKGLNAGPVGSAGVLGRHTASGTGVYGNSAGGEGVLGVTAGTTANGMHGKAPNSIGTALNAVGVRGEGTVGVLGTGEYMGVQGSSLNYAVFGYTTPDTGGIGTYGRGAIGVKGRSYSGNAVLGDTDDGVGVKGESYSDGGAVKAIHGIGFGVSNNGVVGEASNGTSAYGVWGISSTGYAGVFSGKVPVTGTLAKGGGSFRIDHPLDPEHKYLSHSFVESPDMMNVYNGNIVTDAKGEATVQLPRYFEALNRDFRYQLTVIGAMAQAVVSQEVASGRFAIRSDRPRVKVSWQVTGIRKDPFANEYRIPVEEDKKGAEVGTYLHPDVYGKPSNRFVDHARIEGIHRAPARASRDAELRRPTMSDSK